MNYIYWALFLIIISSWILGYYYVNFSGDISAKEQSISMAVSKLESQIAGLEREKEKLDKSIQDLVQKVEEYREKQKQLSEQE